MATYHLRLKNDTTPNGSKVSAKGHADYILRENDEQQNDLIYKGSQLPRWADGSAQKFFEAATRYEDKSNRRFKELEMSLPNELTLEQNLEIVNAFIAKHLPNHYYAFAIHEKVGALSGEKHPHVRIMFSERLIDDVERIKERPAYKYFKRAAKPLKNELVASFERRCEHGALKNKKWHDRNYVSQIRAVFARKGGNAKRRLFSCKFKFTSTERLHRNPKNSFQKPICLHFTKNTSKKFQSPTVFLPRQYKSNSQ